MTNQNGESQEAWSLYSWADVPSPWTLAETALQILDRIYMWGPPGVGKTFVATQSQTDQVQLTLAEDLTVQELMGHYLPEGNIFRFHYGPISRAFQEGRLLILNEVARASGSVQDFLLSVLDGPEVASITLPNGDRITCGVGFKVVATSNAPPEDLDPALRSRFEAEIELPTPNPALTSLIEGQRTGLGQALMDSFRDPTRALDPRKVQSFLRMLRSNLSVRQCALLAFGERAPDVVAVLEATGVDLG